MPTTITFNARRIAIAVTDDTSDLTYSISDRQWRRVVKRARKMGHRSLNSWEFTSEPADVLVR